MRASITAGNSLPWGKLLPVLGPIALFVVWDIVVRMHWVSPVLLPSPIATLVGFSAQSHRYSDAKRKSPLRSPVKIRPVRFPP